jgi:hypothetical protein
MGEVPAFVHDSSDNVVSKALSDDTKSIKTEEVKEGKVYDTTLSEGEV